MATIVGRAQTQSQIEQIRNDPPAGGANLIMERPKWQISIKFSNIKNYSLLCSSVACVCVCSFLLLLCD